jgi:hypothetical protein
VSKVGIFNEIFFRLTKVQAVDLIAKHFDTSHQASVTKPTNSALRLPDEEGEKFRVFLLLVCVDVITSMAYNF